MATGLPGGTPSPQDWPRLKPKPAPKPAPKAKAPARVPATVRAPVPKAPTAARPVPVPDTMDENGLVAQILRQSPDRDVALALLMGAMGEGTLNPKSSGTGGGGAFGFTPPYYPAALETAVPSQQVAAIMPKYIAAAQKLPRNVTGSARAEWIALNAERPADVDNASVAYMQARGQYPYQSPVKPGMGETETIAATDQLTQYGGASGVNPGSNWHHAANAYNIGVTKGWGGPNTKLLGAI